MRWFKHLSTSQEDDIMAELISEFGAEGYGLWWIILEKIAMQVDEKDTVYCRFSAKKWAGFGEVSTQRFRKIAKFLDEKMSTFSVVDDGKYIRIECPNILKYRDEWTKKKKKNSGVAPEPLRSKSGETPESLRSRADTDTNTNTEERKKGNARDKKNDRYIQQVIDEFKQILPELCPENGLRVSATLKKQISARCKEFKERREIQWWRDYWQSIRGRPFLMGQVKSDFVAGISFLTKKSKMDSVLSGEYRGKSQVNRPADQGLAEKDYTQGAERWNKGPVQ